MAISTNQKPTIYRNLYWDMVMTKFWLRELHYQKQTDRNKRHWSNNGSMSHAGLSSICSLCKWADTAFWLWGAELPPCNYFTCPGGTPACTRRWTNVGLMIDKYFIWRREVYADLHASKINSILLYTCIYTTGLVRSNHMKTNICVIIICKLKTER